MKWDGDFVTSFAESDFEPHDFDEVSKQLHDDYKIRLDGFLKDFSRYGRGELLFITNPILRHDADILRLVSVAKTFTHMEEISDFCKSNKIAGHVYCHGDVSMAYRYPEMHRKECTE